MRGQGSAELHGQDNTEFCLAAGHAGVDSDDNHFTIGAEAIDEGGHGLGARSAGEDDLCAAELLELGGGVEGRGTERSCYSFRLGAPDFERLGT